MDSEGGRLGRWVIDNLGQVRLTINMVWGGGSKRGDVVWMSWGGFRFVVKGEAVVRNLLSFSPLLVENLSM
jgi:hypothetical protein